MTFQTCIQQIKQSLQLHRPFSEIERWIDHTPLPDDEKAALWLYAWSATHYPPSSEGPRSFHLSQRSTALPEDLNPDAVALLRGTVTRPPASSPDTTAVVGDGRRSRSRPVETLTHTRQPRTRSTGVPPPSAWDRARKRPAVRGRPLLKRLPDDDQTRLTRGRARDGRCPQLRVRCSVRFAGDV
jgi:hypothetical protein